MQSADDVVITDEMRKQYAARYIQDESTIRSMEYIKAQTSERLQKVVTRINNCVSWDPAEVTIFAKELRPGGQYINHNWIIAEVGEVLYMRDDLPEDDWLVLQEKI